jgi:hypothetical protein
VRLSHPKAGEENTAVTVAKNGTSTKSPSWQRQVNPKHFMFAAIAASGLHRKLLVDSFAAMTACTIICETFTPTTGRKLI